MLLQPVILGSQNATSAVNGATTEPRIRINRPDDENARCRVSRVRVQPKNFSQPTQLTTLSTSNAISPPQKRTEPSGPRRCRRGATSLCTINLIDMSKTESAKFTASVKAATK